MVLVGHSYGGMVITGVVDRIPDRIKRVVYLDALLPDSGESLMSIPDTARAKFVQSVTRDGWPSSQAKSPGFATTKTSTRSPSACAATIPV